jgi:hypothetical protein
LRLDSKKLTKTIFRTYYNSQKEKLSNEETIQLLKDENAERFEGKRKLQLSKHYYAAMALLDENDPDSEKKVLLSSVKLNMSRSCTNKF